MAKAKLYSLLLLLLLIGYFTGWFLPFVSSLVVSIKASPAIWLLALASIASVSLSIYFYVNGRRLESNAFGLLFVTFIVLAVLSGFPAMSQVGNTVKVVELKRLPDLIGIYRLIPLPTAYKYAIDRIQNPTHTIYYSESYVYYRNTTPIYNWLIEPEGLLNSLTRSPIGAVFVYGDKYPPEVKIVKQELYWGLHNAKFAPFFLDTLSLELLFKGAFGKAVLWDDVSDVYYEGQILQLIPIEDYETLFPGALPRLDSYAVVYPNGSIELVKPSEVKKFGIPVLPERIAREWVECLRWKDWVQALFFHNTFTIRDVGDNPQPYLLLDRKGRPWWVFVAEPPGNTYSAYMVLLVNASSTEPVVYVYKFETPEIGISKAYSYVLKAHPNWAWNSLKIQEPMPTLINSTLYWKLSVTTSDSRGLVSVELLNAKTGEVKSFPVKGTITAEELLNGLLGKGKFSEVRKENPYEAIIKKIEKIKEELNELERALKQIIARSSQTATKAK